VTHLSIHVFHTICSLNLFFSHTSNKTKINNKNCSKVECVVCIQCYKSFSIGELVTISLENDNIKFVIVTNICLDGVIEHWGDCIGEEGTGEAWSFAKLLLKWVTLGIFWTPYAVMGYFLGGYLLPRSK